MRPGLALWVAACLLTLTGCKTDANGEAGKGNKPFMSGTAATPPQVPDDALPPEKTGGFDGAKAYEHVAKLVGFGPRPSGSQAILEAQDYITSQLSSFGCTVDADSFSADTPAGRLPMKNIVAKIPGERQGIILLSTHYDTKKLDNFVGADDGGSSTGVMLELARKMCSMRPRYSIWIAFFDGEEAVRKEWQDPDNRYGSRQMAAQMAASGDLPKIKAFLLADIVGGKNPHFKRDGESTKWLRDMVWDVAVRLGYGDVFVNELTNFGGDDHYTFTARKVPSVDIMDLDFNDVPYWHTPQDTMDKIDAKTLAMVGHVILESVKEIQEKK